MKRIEMTLLASEYWLKVSFRTQRRAMKMASTIRYLKQKRPSLITIDSRLRHRVHSSISMKRARKLREMR